MKPVTEDEDRSTFDATPMPGNAGGGTPSRRSPLAYYTSAAKRSFRDAFGKQQLLDGAKAFLWVAPLTMLIWIYAEREQLSTKTIKIPIEVKITDDPKQVVRVVKEMDETLSADATGPRAALDRLRDELARTDARALIEVKGLHPGRQPVSIESVANDPRFADSGVTLGNISPGSIEVVVDVLEDVELQVALPPDVPNVVSAVFNPPTVKMSVPSGAVRDAPKPLVAYVDKASFTQLKTPGKADVKDVRVLLPTWTDRNAVLLTKTVGAAVEVKQSDVDYQISSIPVFVTFQTGVDYNKFKANFEPALPSVTVSGPQDLIDDIKSGKAVPNASFVVSLDAVAAGGATAQVKYTLPKGVRVKDDDEKRTITFTIVPQTTPE